jgi:O-antigen/teichoic acid export membrane protein
MLTPAVPGSPSESLTSQMTTKSSQPTKGLRGRLFSGLRWTGASQVVQQALNLSWSVVMAHLLLPSDFGLLAMASVFTGLVYFVLDMGLSTVIVQRPSLEENQLSSIFWLNIMLGLGLTLLGIASSWPIAAFYSTPMVQPVTALMSCNFLLFSLGTTQTALLTRRMEFRSLEVRNLAGLVLGSVCSIGMALLGFGVWSLVARLLVASLVGTILLWFAADLRPRLHFQWADVREFIGFSTEVLMGNIVGYAGRNADNLLIGRFLGAINLGYYSLAYNLMMFPVQRFTQALVSVLFPAFSRLQEDHKTLVEGWFRATRLLGALVAPLMFGLAALTGPFVLVVYGQKWLPAVPVLQVLALSGLVQSLAWLDSTVLIALGQSSLRLKLVTAGVAVSLGAFILGLSWGIVGVAAFFVIGNAFMSFYALIRTLGYLQTPVSAYLSNLAGVLTSAFLMTCGVLLLTASIEIRDLPGLLGAVCFGAFLYLLFLFWFAPKIIGEVLDFLPQKLAHRLPKLLFRH